MQHQTTYSSSQIIPQFPEQEHLNCPRCDSSNTKFCYYNNYNLSQPRHFCKSCKRYWTKGGTLRNIPVGGVIRKNNTKRSSNRKRSSAISSQDPPKPEELESGFSSPNGQFMSLLVGLNKNGAMQLGESTTDNPNSSSESNMIGREFGSSEEFSGGDSSYCYWNGASGTCGPIFPFPGQVKNI